MKQTERDSNKRIAFPIQLFGEGSADVQIPDVIQVVPVGKWDHPAYGEMEITSAHIAEFVQNFKDKVRLDIPINAGHDNGMSGGELPAVGWFTDVEDRGVNGLWAGLISQQSWSIKPTNRRIPAAGRGLNCMRHCST